MLYKILMLNIKSITCINEKKKKNVDVAIDIKK